MPNDYDLIECKFSTFCFNRSRGDRTYHDYIEVPYINDDLKYLAIPEFKNKKIFPDVRFTFDGNVERLQFALYYDGFFMKYLDGASYKDINKQIESINSKRHILRQVCLQKFYKSTLVTLIDDIFGDREIDLPKLSSYNFIIYNYIPNNNYLEMVTPIYNDDNYEINKLTLDSAFIDVAKFLNPLKKNDNETIKITLRELIGCIAFIEMYDNKTENLLFRIINSEDADVGFRYLKEAFYDKKNPILTEDDLEELRFYSSINFKRVLKVNAGKFNFDI